ncbi:TonB-dependent receptor plug domain-containing protein [Acinetobacter baumannii]|uniref:TonB-dependent receptor plug domain-containing protein n=1 Tax=Acinetobacter baumannii TaxID=470 RepID=UPI00102296C9|nr:TonB-dependent receptor [Acinetobacter baumannii]MDC4303609.1 TonB-dependent receptor [Acinetobacter baumannii]MDC4858866.1 TonB-dependent receptor [Acinetobacter baumannii]MDH2534835.1 TonB-dependent receptor [Acinetobacter baumannii]MDH2621825.1 TonB-dependent receptor [Acinetobacter baumannii]RYL17589.1 TonB-dependent receptor [Acinetobacter baumannii]
MEHVMSKSFQPTRLVGAIAIAMGCSPVIFAEDATDATQLDPIVITASKSAEKASEVPARISVIDEKTIEQNPIADLPSLLRKEAGLTIHQTGGYGQTASVFIRGASAGHTLFLQDGMRSNTATVAGQNIHLFDTTDIKQIEILRGPASVQYGTDAIGGVIQLISKTPTQNKIFTTIEAGEKNTYKSILGIDLAQDGYYAQIRGQRFETDGDQIISNDDRKAGFDQKGYSAKVGVDKEQYALSAEIKENKGTGDFFSYGAAQAYDFTNRLYNVNARLNLTNNIIWNTRLSQFEDQYNLIKAAYPSIVNTKQQEVDSNIKWQFTPSQNILFGVEHNKTTAEKVVAYNGDTGFDNSNKTTGYYLQHQYQHDGINTQAGIRVEDNDQFGTHTVGQLAGRFLVTPTTSVYANIGTAFRAPVVGQIITEPAWWGGNPDLKPEESVSYELGFDQKLNHGFTVYGSVYQTKVDNLMVSSAATNFVFYNIDKATLTGAELGLKWSLDNWFINAEYAYIQPKNDETDQDAPNRPRQNFNMNIGWDNGVYGFNTAFVAKGKAKDIQDVPGYTTLDFNAYWQMSPNVKIFTNIQNLYDTDYKTAWNKEVGSYYIASGRLASAGVTLSY